MDKLVSYQKHELQEYLFMHILPLSLTPKITIFYSSCQCLWSVPKGDMPENPKNDMHANPKSDMHANPKSDMHANPKSDMHDI